MLPQHSTLISRENAAATSSFDMCRWGCCQLTLAQTPLLSFGHTKDPIRNNIINNNTEHLFWSVSRPSKPFFLFPSLMKRQKTEIATRKEK